MCKKNLVKMDNDYLNYLYSKIKKRKKRDINESYSSKLLNDPNLLSKKIGEESTEVIIEILNKDKKNLINESTDLLYHLMVSWVYLDINPSEIWNEFKNREKKEI